MISATFELVEPVNPGPGKSAFAQATIAMGFRTMQRTEFVEVTLVDGRAVTFKNVAPNSFVPISCTGLKTSQPIEVIF